MPKSERIVHPNCAIELHRLDCMKGLGDAKIVEPGSVDVIVTSPPYNLGIRYSRYDDTISRADYLKWMRKWAKRVYMALSEDGSLFLNIGSKPSDPGVPFAVLGEVLDAGFKLQNTFHWVKSVAIDKEHLSNGSEFDEGIVLGHYKPINSHRFVNDCHEYVFHLTKHGNVELDRRAEGVGVPYQDKSNVTCWRGAGSDVHCRGNVWFIPYRTISNRLRHRPHPATFPPELPEMCLRLHGVNRIRRVLDPFTGIGNSAIACHRLGLDFIGFEIDPGYYDTAIAAVHELVAGDAGPE